MFKLFVCVRQCLLFGCARAEKGSEKNVSKKKETFFRNQVGDSEMFLSLAGVRGGDIQMLVGTFDRNPVLHYLALAGRW